MLKLPSSLDSLSVEQLHDKYGPPETVAVSRVDGGPLPHNVPKKAVLPLHLGKNANEISLADTHLILADFGEAFAPASRMRPCQDCRSPLAARPPEARFEPPSPLSFSADIWCLAVAMWNLVAMKPLFSDEFVTPDAVLAQQVDVLGPLPSCHPVGGSGGSSGTNFLTRAEIPLKEGMHRLPSAKHSTLGSKSTAKSST
ncbi:hypothetical protein J3459_014099 [Metarhizium acridum]|nr:hypothetical protein J3459_014099 [Metarhizium acridum]